MKYWCLLCCLTPLMAQTELYLPWVPQNQTFKTKIVLNNHNPDGVIIQLHALRNSDEQDTATIELGPFGSYQAEIPEAFPQLGEGSGAVVTITSQAENITASCIVASTTTDSGSSPAQMNAIPRDQASFQLAFHHLPIREEGFSAPVIVNVGEQEATVMIHGYNSRKHLGSVERIIGAGGVFAAETTHLFPEATGDLYLIAESNRPLIGSTFLFNQSREPSMAPGQKVQNIPDPLNTFFEIFIAASSPVIRIGDSTTFLTQGDSYQIRTRLNINHLFTWINDSPELIDLVTEGDQAGKVTGKRAGLAQVRAQARGGVETYAMVRILGRPISLFRGSNCDSSLRECMDWEPIRTPKYITDNHIVDPANTAPIPLDFFRIIGDDQPIRIKEIQIEDNAVISGQVSGLEEGQIIAPGETVIFSLDANLLEASTREITFNIILEDNGVLLNARFFVSPPS